MDDEGSNSSTTTMGPTSIADDGGPGDELVRGARVGRYVLIDEIGRGGMGVVYSAFDPELARRLALKVLHHGAGGFDPDRLLDEARALARVRHPNVVTIHDAGSTGSQVFIAMDLVEGTTLRERLREGTSRHEVMEMLLQAGRGLAAAHGQGVVHLDFKPSNVVVERRAEGPVARVIDFGLARLPRTSAFERDDPMHAGTPAYMAPEVLDRGVGDAKSDQWSFALTCVEALTGKRPPRAASIDEATEGTGALRPILRVALHDDPAQRFASMDALLDAMSRARQRRRRIVRGSIGAVAIAALVGTVVVLQRDTCSGDRAELEQTWNASVRLQLIERLAASSVDPGLPDRVGDAIDDWAVAWSEMHRQTCESVRRRERSELHLDAMMRCLTSQRHRVDALLAAAETADVEQGWRLFDLASDLEAPSSCETSTTRKLAADRAAAEQVEHALAEAQVAVALHRFEDALTHARKAVDVGDRDRDPVLRARSRVQLARVQMELGALDEARQALELASWLAIEAEDDWTLAEAFSDMVMLEGALLRHDDTARVLSGYARAYVEKTGDPRPRWRLEYVLGSVARNMERYDEAKAAFERALQALESFEHGARPEAVVRLLIADMATVLDRFDEAKAGYAKAREILGPQGASHPMQGDILSSEVNFYSRQENFEEALRVSEQALAIYRATYGERHLKVARALSYVAAMQGSLGDNEASIELASEALAMLRELGLSDEPSANQLRSDIGGAYLVSGRPRLAEPWFEEALASLGDGDSQPHLRAVLHQGIALALLEQDDPDAAAPHVERALTLYGSSFPAGHTDLLDMQVTAGRAAYARGRFAEARQVLTAVYEAVQNTEASSAYLRARTAYWLSRAHHEDRPPNPTAAAKALELAEASRRTLEGVSGSMVAVLRTEVEVWLKELRRRGSDQQSTGSEPSGQ